VNEIGRATHQGNRKERERILQCRSLFRNPYFFPVGCVMSVA